MMNLLEIDDGKVKDAMGIGPAIKRISMQANTSTHQMKSSFGRDERKSKNDSESKISYKNSIRRL